MDAGPTWIGRTIGSRYQIQTQLGSGGMSSVYQATDTNLRRDVAIKIIHPHLTDNPEFIERFELEATAIAQLRHANIVKVFDFSHDHGIYFMVMEYIAGQTLAQKLANLREASALLPLPEILRITATTCDAVDYAHRQGLLHRDIKPANIIIDLLGEPILTDFGIAQLIGHTKTNTGSLIGTAAYMAPELLQGDAADHRADIYSLGIMLYEMVSGTPPFIGDTTFQIMLRQVNEPPPDLTNLHQTVPADLTAIVHKALAKDPNGRFPTAADMANALRSFSAQIETKADSLSARHQNRLASLWQVANDSFDRERYADCLTRLEELQHADDSYRADDITSLRQKAMDAIYYRAANDAEHGRFADAEVGLAQLEATNPNYGGIPPLTNAIENGRQQLELTAKLDNLYDQALSRLREQDYRGALAQWETLQDEAKGSSYIDRLDLVNSAWDGISRKRYNTALAAFAAGRTQEALSLWQIIQQDNPGYPDHDNLINQIEALESRRAYQRQALLWGAGITLALLVVAALFFMQRNNNATAESPSPTSTTAAPLLAAINTATAVAPESSPTSPATATTPPTATATQPATTTPTIVPATPTPFPDVTAVPFPEYLAAVTEPSSMFTAPTSASQEVALIRIDDPIVILARSASGTWLYVRNSTGDSGYIFGERVLWDGNRDTLPVRETAATNSSAETSGSFALLELDLWPLPGTVRCNPNGSSWTQQIYFNARGGNGRYTYLWNGSPVAGPVSGSYNYLLRSGGAAVITTGGVTSGDGQSLTVDFFVPRPNCGG